MNDDNDPALPRFLKGKALINQICVYMYVTMKKDLIQRGFLGKGFRGLTCMYMCISCVFMWYIQIPSRTRITTILLLLLSHELCCFGILINLLSKLLMKIIIFDLKEFISISNKL